MKTPTHQQLAATCLEIIGKVSVPLTLENAVAGLALYEMLGAIASGELILAKSVPSEAPKG